MGYVCKDCQYFKDCPGHKGDKFKSFVPGSSPCIAIHENPERGLKVANASPNELYEMLKEKFLGDKG